MECGTYLTAPTSAFTSLCSRLDELQERLSHILDMHPGINIRPRAKVERSTRLDTRMAQRRIENAVDTTRPGAPTVYDGRAHNRGLDRRSSNTRASCPSLLDELLGVSVHRLVRHGPDGVDVADVRPYLGVQLAEVVPLRDDARAAEVDVEGWLGGGGAGADAC